MRDVPKQILQFLHARIDRLHFGMGDDAAFFGDQPLAFFGN